MDYIEDLASGRREQVFLSPWNFLIGQKVSEAKQLPEVFDVVIPVAKDCHAS